MKLKVKKMLKSLDELVQMPTNYKTFGLVKYYHKEVDLYIWCYPKTRIIWVSEEDDFKTATSIPAIFGPWIGPFTSKRIKRLENKASEDYINELRMDLVRPSSRA